MILTRYPVFIFLTLLLTLSSCQQNDRAFIFYHQVNAIYAQENKAVSNFLNGQQRSAKVLESELDKCVANINELAPFEAGDSLKSAIMEELLMWNKFAALAGKKQAAGTDTTAISALTKEMQDLQMNRTTLHKRVNAANEKFANEFRLEPLNTSAEEEPSASKQLP